MTGLCHSIIEIQTRPHLRLSSQVKLVFSRKALVVSLFHYHNCGTYFLSTYDSSTRSHIIHKKTHSLQQSILQFPPVRIYVTSPTSTTTTTTSSAFKNWLSTWKTNSMHGWCLVKAISHSFSYIQRWFPWWSIHNNNNEYWSILTMTNHHHHYQLVFIFFPDKILGMDSCISTV